MINSLSLLRAFDAWCADQGLSQRAGEIRVALARHFNAYRTPEALVLEPLFKTVPDEFNVRGRWVTPLVIEQKSAEGIVAECPS
jgi:hypothetical protein